MMFINVGWLRTATRAAPCKTPDTAVGNWKLQCCPLRAADLPEQCCPLRAADLPEADLPETDLPAADLPETDLPEAA